MQRMFKSLYLLRRMRWRHRRTHADVKYLARKPDSHLRDRFAQRSREQKRWKREVAALPAQRERHCGWTGFIEEEREFQVWFKRCIEAPLRIVALIEEQQSTRFWPVIRSTQHGTPTH